MGVGITGPIGKRDEERIRRNIPDIPTQTVTAIGVVTPPGLGIHDAHRLVREIWESLKESAQSRFFEPSDWTYAKLTLWVLNDYLNERDKEGKKLPISAMKLAAVDSMMSKLLVTEGDRRRVRMEIERRPTGDPGATVLQAADRFKEALSKQATKPGT